MNIVQVNRDESIGGNIAAERHRDRKNQSHESSHHDHLVEGALQSLRIATQ